MDFCMYKYRFFLDIFAYIRKNDYFCRRNKNDTINKAVVPHLFYLYYSWEVRSQLSYRRHISMKKIILFFALVCSLQTMAISLVVEQHSGAQLLQDVAMIGKWVFEGDNLLLLDKADQVLAVESIANIKKITFSNEVPSAVEDVVENTVLVYPNPTQDVLMIQGAESQLLRVYDMQGRLLKTEQGEQVVVGDLPDGTYLLQVGAQVVRFIKK